MDWRTQCIGGFDKLPFPNGDRLVADDSGMIRPCGNSDGNNCVLQACSKECGDGHSKKEGRKGLEDIHNAHDNIVNQSAQIACDSPQGHPDDDGNSQCEQGREHGYSGAQDNSLKDVPSQFIRAEPVRCGRGKKFACRVEIPVNFCCAGKEERAKDGKQE